MAEEEIKVEALCREILDSVLEEIKAQYHELPRSLKEIAEEKKSLYTETTEQLQDEYEQRSSRERTTTISQAQFKVQRRVVENKDFLVEEIMKEGYELAIETFELNWLELSLQLAQEGCKILDTPKVLVHLAQPREQQESEGFSEELTRRMGRALEIEVAFDLSEAGVVVEDKTGRASFDNRLEDRWRRAREKLRAATTKLLEDEAKSLKGEG